MLFKNFGMNGMWLNFQVVCWVFSRLAKIHNSSSSPLPSAFLLALTPTDLFSLYLPRGETSNLCCRKIARLRWLCLHRRQIELKIAKLLSGMFYMMACAANSRQLKHPIQIRWLHPVFSLSYKIPLKDVLWRFKLEDGYHQSNSDGSRLHNTVCWQGERVESHMPHNLK